MLVEAGLIVVVILVLILAFLPAKPTDYINKNGDRIRVHANGTIENMDMGRTVRRYLKEKEEREKKNNEPKQ